MCLSFERPFDKKSQSKKLKSEKIKSATKKFCNLDQNPRAKIKILIKRIKEAHPRSKAKKFHIELKKFKSRHENRKYLDLLKIVHEILIFLIMKMLPPIS